MVIRQGPIQTGGMAQPLPSCRRWLLLILLLGGLLLPASSLQAGETGGVMAVLEPGEERPGGAATSFKAVNRSVFSHPSATIDFRRQLDFRVGDGVFRKLWTSSPSSTTASDGLGPLYNARSCQSCHLKDGRGRPPAAGEEAVSMFLRLSIPPQTSQHQDLLSSLRVPVIPDPVYGTQLQNFSVQGLHAEGSLRVGYSEFPVDLSDGETVMLRRPVYGIDRLQYGPLHSQVMLSPRVAPQMIGLGLLEAIPEGDLLVRADPEDADGDGIAGQPNRVWSPDLQRIATGRFGWKAGAATIADQTAFAFTGDIGLSTHLTPASHGDCTPAQTLCRQGPTGDGPAEGVEVPRRMFDLVVFYTRNLAVPVRRDPQTAAVLRGKALFAAAGCAGCHVPRHQTGKAGVPAELAGLVIWPYTDLLLHDMGEGLADHRPEGLANGRQWRTAPLWGIGLTRTVSGHDFLLHDGRARNLLEAILWHDGEARRARLNVIQMSRNQRHDLLAFIQSL